MNHWHTDFHSPHRGLTFAVEQLLHTEQSAFQKIEVLQTPAFGKVLLLDDVLMLTETDEFTYHEMLAHPALFSHPEPQSVLIIGGGDCGTLTRVLQHSTVSRVLMVELDERVTRVSKRFFPQLAKAGDDPRAELLFADGIGFVRDTEEQFDVILIDSTDPVGPAEGLFREPFFADCRRALKPGGILCLQSESPWMPELGKVIGEVHRDLRSLFPLVRAYSAAIQTYQAGLWLFQLASTSPDPLAPEVGARISSAALPTRYYNRDLHYAAFSLPTFVLEQLG
ncbi:MAG: polyamine aminopropyltransferase [Candidatus Cloacimonetes bacterium]|nr:polyamine aminopropyltransferase [Candidatus Cloacimonadota bacterium]MDY0368014.1 polyamine aminopropyltransferase [Candidatus Syntrophosphaera sp.]HPH60877.1 polyamine aminopropyltransferase [Candidatus Syntrophosphaera sp.]